MKIGYNIGVPKGKRKKRKAMRRTCKEKNKKKGLTNFRKCDIMNTFPRGTKEN
jgi:hypothetical protein